MDESDPSEVPGGPFCLGIVIPLKSRTVARSWPEVQRRLRATVATLCHQSSTNWRAVIVGDERPDLGDWSHPNLSFTTFDRSPLADGYDGRVDATAVPSDFQRKRAFGMRMLAAGQPITHWFMLDADDLVHRDFVATVSGMRPFELAVVRNGFAYYPTRRTYRHLDRIDRFCGSTVITSERWWIDPDAPGGRRYASHRHRHVDEDASSRGVSIHDYPGRGVAYVLGHGDNMYATVSRRIRVWLESRLLARRCDDEFFAAFGRDNAG